MKLRLVVQTDGGDKGRVLDVPFAQFLIGRDPECHLRATSPRVSRFHCALITREGRAYLQDFESTNGTILNDRPIKGEVDVADGDVLKVGPMSFVIKIETAAPINAAPPVSPSAVAARAADKPPLPQPRNQPWPSSDDEIAALVLNHDIGAGVGPLPEEKASDGGSTVVDLAPVQVKEDAKKAEAEAKAADDKRSEDEIAALLLSDDTSTGVERLPAEKAADGSTLVDLAAMQAQEDAKKAEAKAANDKRKGLGGDTRSAAESLLKKYMKRSR